MRKWTYLVAALLSAGVTVGTFSSCIDNDEPEGISILRQAKAELIAAKKALVEAQAKKAEADAQKTLIEAECAKLRAEAEAAQTDAETARIQAEIEVYLKESEIRLKQMQLAYDTALAEFEKLKLQLSNETADLVEQYYTAYFDAQSEYNRAYMDYISAQREYTNAVLDPNGIDLVSEQTLKNEVAKAQAALDQAKADAARLEEEIAEAKEMTPTDLGKKYTDLMKERKENKEAIAKIEIEKAELVRETDLATKINDAKEELTKAKKKEIEIAKFTYKFDDFGVPGFSGEYTVWEDDEKTSANELIYSINDLTNYDAALGEMKNFQTSMKNLVLDEDDKLWTQAKANEMAQELPGLIKAYQADSVQWARAVKAYNMGKGDDLTVFTKYADVKKGVDALNSALTPVSTALKAQATAEAKLKTETDKFSDKDEAAKVLDTKRKAYASAAERQKEIKDKAAKDYTDAIKPLQDAVENASKAYDKALAAWAKDETTQKNPDLVEARINARDDYNKAKDNADASVMGSDAYVALTAKNAKDKQADDDYNDAIKIADAAYKSAIEKLYKADTKVDAAAYENAVATVEQAEKTLAEVIKAANEKIADLNKASKAFADNKDEVSTKGTYNNVSLAADGKLSIGTKADFLKEDNTYNAVAVTNVIGLNTSKTLVEEFSKDLYGRLYEDANNDKNEYGISEHHLKAHSKSDIDALIKAVRPKITPEDLIDLYNEAFGSYGKYLYAQAKVDIVKLYAGNADKVNGALASIGKAIETLEASKKAQDAVVKKAEDAVKALEDEQTALTADLDKKSAALTHENELIETIIEAVLNAAQVTEELDSYNPDFSFESKVPNFDENTIKEYIKGLQSSLDYLVKGSVSEDYEFVNLPKITDLEQALEKAQHNLKAWEDGEFSIATYKKDALDRAELELNLAKEKMDYRKAQLDKAIARLEAAE